jgi:hypothetical protein
MSEAVLPNSMLDGVLALQIVVAWAGEGGGDAPRLRWWNSGLTDRDGGGDFFERSAPATSRWAMLDAVRRAATIVDQRIRRAHMAAHDQVRTIYHLGYTVDEALNERLRVLKQAGEEPSAVLNFPFDLDGEFDQGAFDRFVDSLGDVPRPKIAPVGRELPGRPPQGLELMMRHLVGALRPLPGEYPMPFYRVAA